MLQASCRLRIISMYIKTHITPPSICTELSSPLNCSDSVVFAEKQNFAVFSTQYKEILEILEELQETYKTNQHTTQNERAL